MIVTRWRERLFRAALTQAQTASLGKPPDGIKRTPESLSEARRQMCERPRFDCSKQFEILAACEREGDWILAHRLGYRRGAAGNRNLGSVDRGAA